LEFHYAPKHASWLNLVELSILSEKERNEQRAMGD